MQGQVSVVVCDGGCLGVGFEETLCGDALFDVEESARKKLGE